MIMAPQGKCYIENKDMWFYLQGKIADDYMISWAQSFPFDKHPKEYPVWVEWKVEHINFVNFCSFTLRPALDSDPRP